MCLLKSRNTVRSPLPVCYREKEKFTNISLGNRFITYESIISHDGKIDENETSGKTGY